MKFIAFTMVKNEEDIIEQFIRHNLNYCDVIYIYDHYSNDNTTKIIKSCQNEGLSVYLSNDAVDGLVTPSHSFIQAEVMTLSLRVIHMHHQGAVYFPLDADEFIYDHKGPQHFRDKLEKVPNNTWFEVPWRCLYNKKLVSGSQKNHDVLMKFNIAQNLNTLKNSTKKSIIKLDNNVEVNSIIITQGNHAIIDEKDHIKKIDELDIYYFHAPIRSSEQIARKIIIGWLSNVRRRGKNTKNGASTWGNSYHSLINTNSLKMDDISQLIDEYSCKNSTNNDEFWEKIDLKNIFNYNLRYIEEQKGSISSILQSLEDMMDHAYKEGPHYKAENINKFNLIETLLMNGVILSDALDQVGMDELDYNYWKNEYKTHNKSDDKLIELENENSLLRRAVVDLTINKIMLKS